MTLGVLRVRMALAVLLGQAAVGWAAGAAPLTSLRAIHSLTNEQAANSLPVAFQATVTYHAKDDVDLFVQDGDVALYVEVPRTVDVNAGDRVLVLGKTRASFRPDVVAERVVLLHSGTLPHPAPASYVQLIRSELDCRRVTVHARVRSANTVLYGKLSNTYLELLMDGGYVDAIINGDHRDSLKNLLDADIEITGVVSGKFDSKNQLTGIVIETQDFSDVKITKRANTRLDALPVTPMDDILKGYSVLDRTERVRVHGAVTYYQPGSAVVLQDGGKSLWIETLYAGPLHVGDLADATGFPGSRNGSLALTHAEIEDTGLAAPIKPQTVSWQELSSGTNAFDLISSEGRVLMAVREADTDEYVLVSGGHLFSCIYNHPDEETGAKLETFKQIPVGSMVKITGVSVVYYGSDPFLGPVAFNVMLRSLDDITVVARPPWLNVTNLITLAGVLLAVVVCIGTWSWTLRTKVHQQTVALALRTEAEAALERRMARLEKRRSQILEDINGSRPLAEILEQVTELVSMRLNGAPCWCDVAGGARLGNCPTEGNSPRVLSEDIPARSGRSLGNISVGLNPDSPATADELDALSAGAKLAALAIETRKLYDDLRRRSELTCSPTFTTASPSTRTSTR
jgi:hypothetical protein